MKAILIPIQPKWCELISKRQKTVEVRKSAPKLETPFKCYIYCTKKTRKDDLGDYVLYEDEKGFVKENGVLFSPLRTGKVIGEFICDRVDDYVYETEWDICVDIDDDTLPLTMLTRKEIIEYAHGKTLYGWHISELKIYDKPKELSDFSYPCTQKKHCVDCKYSINEEADLPFIVIDSIGCDRRVSRAPQSWCYVEEL